jgi:threonine dehydratase
LSVSLGVVTLDRIREAAAAGAGVIRETPVLSSRTLTDRVGVETEPRPLG